MFVFGGTPPGANGHLAVRLAARSYERVMGEHESILRRILFERMEAVTVPTSVPEDFTYLHRVLQLLGAKSVTDDLANRLKRARSLVEARDELFEEIYPPGFIARGFRWMGRKIGTTAPDRGGGAPRFVLETPTLALLVEGLVEPGRSMSFGQWMDALYSQLGIVAGFGQEFSTIDLLAQLDDTGPLYRAVAENQELLRHRLIRSGLAIEYSDGETEISPAPGVDKP